MVQDDPERKIDAWLDEALARYSATEPRAGLESRVLENLRAETRRVPHRGWKVWAPALATAAAAIIVTVVVVRNRDFPPGRTVTPEHASAQIPAAPTETVAEERQPEATAGRRKPAKTGQSSPQESAGVVRAPVIETAASALTAAGEPGPAKVEPGVTRGARSGARVTSSPHPGSVFPLPAPLSDQERLALAAVRSGLLSSVQPGIPPGDELLPQVAIQEIQIRPLQEIEPI